MRFKYSLLVQILSKREKAAMRTNPLFLKLVKSVRASAVAQMFEVP